MYANKKVTMILVISLISLCICSVSVINDDSDPDTEGILTYAEVYGDDIDTETVDQKVSRIIESKLKKQKDQAKSRTSSSCPGNANNYF